MSVFIAAKYAATPVALEYTATADQIIDKFTVTNVTGTPATVSVYLGGNTIDTLVYSASVAANSTDLCHPIVGQDLSSAEGVYVLAGTASALVIRAGGRAR